MPVSFSLGDDDPEMSAKVGITETTTEPCCYPHPTNTKIKFWDLPGIGTPNNLKETYWEELKLKKYDTFLIFCSVRFTENDLELAKKIRSIGKKFFFVRTKVDLGLKQGNKKKPVNENDVLQRMRSNCHENLGGLVGDKQDVFLISNHHPTKWDFARLTQAIIDVLPTRQQESLTLTIDVLTSKSAEILERKVKYLKKRILLVAAASAAGAAIPVPGVSFVLDFALILAEIKFYKMQLGIPKEGSFKFKILERSRLQSVLRKFCVHTLADCAKLLASYTASSVVEELVRFIPIFGIAVGAALSFTSTGYFLKCSLKELEEVARAALGDMKKEALDGLKESAD